MQTLRTVKPLNQKNDVRVWHCAGCGVVHLAVDDTLIDLERDEYDAFARSAIEAQYSFAQSHTAGDMFTSPGFETSESIH